MLCKSLTDYALIILMQYKLYLEVRSLPYIDSMSVIDVIKKPYTVMKKVEVSFNDAFEIQLHEKLEVVFQESTFFYAVFHNSELNLTIIPEWFSEIMISSKSQSFLIDNYNQKISITVPEKVKLSKFDFLIEE